jgi:hypothetical protein
MYPQSLKLTLRLYPYVLLVIACELVFGPLKGLILTVGGETLYSILIDSRVFRYNTAYFLTLVAQALLMFKTCEQILGVKNKVDVRWVRQFGYFTLILLVFHIPALLLPSTVYLAPMLNEILLEHKVFGWEGDIFLTIVCILTLLFFLGYCLLGIWLPAIVDNQRGGLVAAFSRGKLTFLFVTWRFLVGPTVLFIILSLLSTVYSSLVKTATDWQLTVLVTLFGVLQDIFYCWILVMTAWILSKAYLKTTATPEEAPE